jgi:hypothetical protein
MNALSPNAIRAETITITGHRGDDIEAYRACPVGEPLAEASRGGVVWIHHMPGYDRETKEFVRRLAVSGYHTVAPNLYSREAPGASPDDAAAAARAGWFGVSRATVYVDHPVHAPYGHTVNIDVINPELGPSARVALELTEESALALAEAIRKAIAHAPAGLASKDQT